MCLSLRASLPVSLLALTIAAPTSAQTATERLKTLFEQQWENTLSEAPVFATSLGDTRYNDRLSDEGVAAEARRLDSCWEPAREARLASSWEWFPRRERF